MCQVKKAMSQNVRDYIFCLSNTLKLKSEVWNSNTSEKGVYSKDLLSNAIFSNENKKKIQQLQYQKCIMFSKTQIAVFSSYTRLLDWPEN